MRQECESCGTCCRNGGPPLHGDDLSLIRSGILSFGDLITVRCGEMVLPPMASKPVIARSEWIKLQGQGDNWCCRFFNMNTNQCTIYNDRPVSCRALKCWDTEEVLALAGSDLLSREDIVNKDDPLLPLIHLQEKVTPVPDLEEIQESLLSIEQQRKALSFLTGKVREDLQMRARAAHNFNLNVDVELFYFGRPLFQILLPLGIQTNETPQGIQLQFYPS